MELQINRSPKSSQANLCRLRQGKVFCLNCNTCAEEEAWQYLERLYPEQVFNWPEDKERFKLTNKEVHK